VLAENVELVLSRLRPGDRVLDIGGWAKPFTRADVVVDLMPYETRGVFGTLGPPPERFSAQTWIRHDVSDVAGLPFADDEFDFVICSHILEDIRDPLGLCGELVRVGRAGYVEVPSRLSESVHGKEGRYAGFYHHRWLVDIRDGLVEFRFKSHAMHGSWRYRLPARFGRRLTARDRVQWLFWEGSFEFQEVVQFSFPEVRSELEEFVRRSGAYPSFLHTLARRKDDAALALAKQLQHVPRLRRAVRHRMPLTLQRVERHLWDEQWVGMEELVCRPTRSAPGSEVGSRPS
jgi:hypothetical protein